LPINFGEIADYNKRIAARHYLRAQIARDCGKCSEADYHTQLAVRYIEAAREQKVAMRQEPGSAVENRKLRPWTTLPEPASAAATGWAALGRLARQLATAFRQSISRRSVSIHSLSLDRGSGQPGVRAA
jgi:hypothetical protein